MKKVNHLILYFIILSHLSVSGQYVLEWSKSYPAEYPGFINDIQISNDGGYIAIGEYLTQKSDMGWFAFADLCILKLDAEGKLEWKKIYGGSGIDNGYAIQQTKDGGYIISGNSNSDDGDVGENKGDADAWIIKTDKYGNIEWKKIYGGSNYEEFRSVKQTLDGGYILAGGSRSDDGDIGFNHGNADVWILKISAEGNQEWQKIYGGIPSDAARDIQITRDGGFVLCAHKELNTGSSDFWIIKLSAVGDIEWQHLYGGSRGDSPNAIRQTKDGGFIIAGESISLDGDISNSHGKYEFWVVKLDTLGHLEWESTYGGSEWDMAKDIEQSSDGGYIIVGDVRSKDGDARQNYGRSDAWVIKIDEFGNILWQGNFGGSLDDEPSSVKENPDGSIIVAGESISSDFDVTANSNYYNQWVFKLVPGNSSSINQMFPKFVIGPNPSAGSITILADDFSTSFDVEIINVQGQVIFSKTQIQSPLQIENVEAGQYFIRLFYGSTKFVRKFMVY